MPDADDIVDKVLESADANVASMTSDGQSATAHSLKDLRETADWAENRAARNKPKLPIRYGKFKPGSAE